jgi:predicted small lipoprotein YifL
MGGYNAPVVYRITAVRSLFRFAPATLAAMLLVTACGQKGGLYIPQDIPQDMPQNIPQKAPAASADSTATNAAAPAAAAPADLPADEGEEE